MINVMQYLHYMPEQAEQRAVTGVRLLFRMYTRWAEKHGYSTQTIDYLEGDEAGIKSVTIEISGDNAYGHLKSEHGVHRLVRISPFNAAGKRQDIFRIV